MAAALMTNNNINNNKVQGQVLLSSSSSSVRIEEEIMKQGIITILNSNTNKPCSLQRALSADMSSKKWLSRDIALSEEEKDMHATKTIEDDEESNNREVEEEEAERERLEIWRSIQRSKKEELEKSGSFDMWSSIVPLKGKEEISKSMPITPYVHPLVKRSKSCLSEKSLEICTESLGSETGSDGLLFSSYSSSPSEKTEEVEEEEEVVEQVKEEEEKEAELCSYASVVATKNASASVSASASSPPRAFPPPLPSLSNHHAGTSVTHMRSHRDSGRLVLEAVSVPSHTNFSIQRQDGRLVLTFSNHQEEEEEEEEEQSDDDHVEEMEEECFGGIEFGENEEDYDVEDKAEEEEYFFGGARPPQVYESVPILPGGVASGVHELALMMNQKNKQIGVVNRNPKWSEKFNEMTNFDNVKVATQSLPPRLIPTPPAVAAASFNFNAYEYYWRTDSAAAPKGTSLKLNQLDQEKPHHHQNNMKNNLVVSGDMNKMVTRDQQQLLVLRGKNGDYLVHNLNSCKDSRRSFLFWEPYCIATS